MDVQTNDIKTAAETQGAEDQLDHAAAKTATVTDLTAEELEKKKIAENPYEIARKKLGLKYKDIALAAGVSEVTVKDVMFADNPLTKENLSDFMKKALHEKNERELAALNQLGL